MKRAALQGSFKIVLIDLTLSMIVDSQAISTLSFSCCISCLKEVFQPNFSPIPSSLRRGCIIGFFISGSACIKL